MMETITSQGLPEEYGISDIDADATEPFYYGFQHRDGRWFIMAQENGEFRYARGNEDYETNWTGRGDLTYSYYSDSF